MRTTLTIGTWHEKEREITHCPSYYAADTETLRTKTGDYPLQVTFEGGYLVPMPYWLLVGIETDRIDGRLYSGFGGNNFASAQLPHEPVKYTIQTYQYHLADLVRAGRVTVYSEFEWLLGDKPWEHENAIKTWDDSRFDEAHV